MNRIRRLREGTPDAQASGGWRGFLVRCRNPLAGVEPDSLLGSLGSFAGDSFQYLVGLSLIGAANMVLVPLYTRYLTPTEFGIYALIEITALGLIAVAGLGTNVSYLKLFAEVPSTEVPSLLGTLLATGIVVAAGAGVGFAFVLSTAAGSALLTLPRLNFAWALFPLIVLEVLENLLLTHLRARRRPLAFSTASVLRLVGIVGFSLLLIVGKRAGLAGLFWGRVGGDATGVVAAFLFCGKDLSTRFSARSALHMVRFGLPLVVASLIMMALDGVGRFFLSHYSSLEQLGYYAVGIKISGIMRILVVAPFAAAWGGLIFQIAKKPNARLIYAKLFSYIFLLAVLIALFVALFTPDLLRIFAPRSYAGAAGIVPWLLAVQVATILHYLATVGIFVGAATRWMTPIFCVGLAVDIALSRWLAPGHGMLGVAVAWLAGWVSIALLLGLVGQRHYRVHYEWRPFIVAGAVCLASAAAGRLAVPLPEAVSLGVRGLACVLAGAGILLYIKYDLEHMPQPARPCNDESEEATLEPAIPNYD